MRRTTFLSVFGFLAVCSVGVVVHGVREQTAWREVLDLGTELDRKVEGWDSSRPVLYAEPQDGFALEHYERAVNLLSDSFQEDWVAYVQLREQEPAMANELRDALVERNVDVLARLALGTRQTKAMEYDGWGSQSRGDIPSLMDSRHMANLTVLAAAKYLESDRPERAAEVLLDGMQLGADYLHTPLLITRMIGCAILCITSRTALIEDGLLDQFPPEDLERLAFGMRRLASGLPSISSGWAGETAATIHFAQEAGSSIGDSAEFLLEAERWREFLCATEGRSWQEWSEQFDVFLAKESGRFNLQLLRAAPNVEQSFRGALVQLNLARSAVDYRLTGEVQPLADLFGDELQVTISDDDVYIASAGPDESQRKREIYSLRIDRNE